MMRKESLLPSLVQWNEPAIRRFEDVFSNAIENLVRDFSEPSFFKDVSMFEDIQAKSNFPKINVSETEDKYEVDIAVAGFSKDDVNLELKNNTLVITAEKKDESEDSQDKKYLCREISYRSFSRAVRFPHKIVNDSANADYNEGVIKVTVDKINAEEKDGSFKIDIN